MLVFVSSQDVTVWLSEKLCAAGHRCAAMQSDGVENFESFRKGEVRIVVAADSALIRRRDFSCDFFPCKVVIHYCECRDNGDYFDRVSRMPERSVSLLMLTKDAISVARELGRYYFISIEECPANVAQFL